MRRNWSGAVYQSIAVIATACAILALHSVLKLGWIWAYLVSINGVAFLIFGFDKVFVELLNRLRFRVPENVLIWGLAFPGGMVGAWTAMRAFRHKTSPDKRGFRLELRAALVIQILVIVGYGLLVQVGVVSIAWIDGAIESVVGLVQGFFVGLSGVLRSAVT